MHSYTSENGTTFHHNSDFSGDVLVVIENGKMHKGVGVGIDGQDLLEFVAYQYIARQRVAQIEEASWQDLLNNVALKDTD